MDSVGEKKSSGFAVQKAVCQCSGTFDAMPQVACVLEKVGMAYHLDLDTPPPTNVQEDLAPPTACMQITSTGSAPLHLFAASAVSAL